MLKISCAGCLGLFLPLLPQFTLEIRVAAQNREKFTKTCYFGASRSSRLTFLRSALPVLVTISSMSVPICNHFHVRWANSGSITYFQEGCPSYAPSFVRTPFTQWHEILSRNTRLSYGENLKFLSQLVLKRYRVMSDISTDRQTESP